MYKNFRIGLVKYFAKGADHVGDKMLIEVFESCNGSSGKYYATYHLWLEADKRFCDANIASVGKWVVFGFYIKSIFDKENQKYSTVLKIRHYEELTSEELVKIEVLDSNLSSQSEMMEYLMPKDAADIMEQINEQTNYNR